MSHRFLSTVALLILGGLVAGCTSGPENHIVYPSGTNLRHNTMKPRLGGGGPPPTTGYWAPKTTAAPPTTGTGK